LITPVAKVSKPESYADLRPISVLPILSRVFERIVVRKFIIPRMPVDLYTDQFAYRPTSSTTAALIYTIHHVTHLLESNSFVRCAFIDFSRAFDTINHVLLLRKIIQQNFPIKIILWIANFLTGRTQAVAANGKRSIWLPISQSIIQGSGIGPILYIIFASDLKTVSDNNKICKYADDTTLMVGELSDVNFETEFNNITEWASRNKLKLNLGKTKELIFHKPRAYCNALPVALPGITRVSEIKFLGVVFNSTLCFNQHVDSIVSVVNQRLYLLNKMKQCGLSKEGLHIIFQAIIVSRITYALSAFSGFLNTCDIDRVNAVFRKAKRWGITQYIYYVEDFIEIAQIKLFKCIISNDTHCLYQLLPNKRDCNYDLRTRGHEYKLPDNKTSLTRRAYIANSLYKYI
jgi:hypothetical protein